MPSNHFSVVFKTTHARTNQRWTNDTKRFRRLVCFEEEKAERPLAAPFCSSVDTPTTKCSFFFLLLLLENPPPPFFHLLTKERNEKKEKKNHTPSFFHYVLEPSSCEGKRKRNFHIFFGCFSFVFQKISSACSVPRSKCWFFKQFYRARPSFNLLYWVLLGFT